jgi:hypothetical protein
MPTIYKIQYKCPRCGEIMYTGGTGSDTREFGPATITCSTCSSTNRTNWRQWADGTMGQKIGWFVYQFFSTLLTAYFIGIFIDIFLFAVFFNKTTSFMLTIILIGAPLILWIYIYGRAIYKVTHDLL